MDIWLDGGMHIADFALWYIVTQYITIFQQKQTNKQANNISLLTDGRKFAIDPCGPKYADTATDRWLNPCKPFEGLKCTLQP